MMLGPSHGVCMKGYYVAIISTTKEKEDINEDLSIAFKIVGDILYRFDSEEVMYTPKNHSDNIFITSTLDPTSHFESAADDVMRVYKEITGKELDLSIDDKYQE